MFSYANILVFIFLNDVVAYTHGVYENSKTDLRSFYYEKKLNEYYSNQTQLRASLARQKFSKVASEQFVCRYLNSNLTSNGFPRTFLDASVDTCLSIKKCTCLQYSPLIMIYSHRIQSHTNRFRDQGKGLHWRCQQLSSNRISKIDKKSKDSNESSKQPKASIF